MVISQSKNLSIRDSRNSVLQNNRSRYIIKQSQSYMKNLSENLSGFKPFNNSITPDDCVDRLVAHRIVSKFHIDDSSRAEVLQSEAFNNYLSYDSGLSDDIRVPSFSRLSSARALLHKWFQDFKVDFSSIRYSVTPGETFISNRGEVSLTAKLLDKKHWTTTANCLDDTCLFIYNNASFKRAAVRHMGRRTRRDKRVLYLKYRHKSDIGYHVFKHLLIDRVLTIVDGARASSVPKSNDKRRFINVEAMFPVILQRAVSSEILRVLANHGNDLSNFRIFDESDLSGSSFVEHSAQWLHGEMIKNSRYSTIDFSNASDSVTIAAVVSLFPRHVSNLLIKLRSHYVSIHDELYSPKKLSSMGNGFTFEVMTSLLFAIGRSFTHDCRVYGDDVIIPNEFADEFVSTCSLIDFNVNADKTFINSFFRESCGYFYSDHIDSYIVSFDFNQILSVSDVIITCNKLTVIIESGQISSDLMSKLLYTRDLIAALVHASRKGPLPPSEKLRRKYLSSYIFDDEYAKKQRRSKDLRNLRQHYIEKNSGWFKDTHSSRNEFSLNFIPFFVPHKSDLVFTSARGLDVLLPALYSGKRLTAVVRGKGRWVDLPAFVHSDGTVTLISNLINSHTLWVDRMANVFENHVKE